MKRPPLLDKRGDEYEADALPLQFRQAFRERGERHRMRMADGDGGAVPSGIASGELELRENGFARFDIIEKHFARCSGDSRLTRSVVSGRGGGGAAVHEK